MNRLQRNFQRQQAQAEAENGWVTDPMRLPFMRILEGVQYIRFLDAFRILVTCGACFLTGGKQEELYLQTIAGLKRSDLEIITRAWGQLLLDMEDRPYRDLLGPAYMAVAHKLDRDSGGEFFTPVVFLKRDGDFFVGVDFSYRSGFSSSATPSTVLNVEGYELVNSRVGFRSTNGWDLWFWTRNLFDKNYYELLSPGFGGTGLYVGQPGDPRTFGVTFRSEF